MAHVQKPKLVVMFDWDNTIMFSGPFLQSVFQATAKHFANKIPLKKEIPLIFTKKREVYLEELFGNEHMPIVMPVFLELYNKMFEAKNLSMFPGARELLEKLDAAKIPIAIISNYTEVGIKEHLDIRGIDYSNMSIVGVDTIETNKPDIGPGLFALNKLHIDPTKEIVHVIMIGDGMDSDMVFASNLSAYLKLCNHNSECKGVLYNASFNDLSIFTPAQIENFIQSKQHPKEMVSYGYGRLFSTINKSLNGSINDQQLMEQHQELRVVGT